VALSLDHYSFPLTFERASRCLYSVMSLSDTSCYAAFSSSWVFYSYKDCDSRILRRRLNSLFL
jgi:hypothetical protein